MFCSVFRSCSRARLTLASLSIFVRAMAETTRLSTRRFPLYRAPSSFLAVFSRVFCSRLSSSGAVRLARVFLLVAVVRPDHATRCPRCCRPRRRRRRPPRCPVARSVYSTGIARASPHAVDA